MSVHSQVKAAGRCLLPTGGHDAGCDGELPDIILRDIASRKRPQGHVIVFANEKGGVGKSTLAFHTAVTLCYAGHRVAVIDLDGRQQTLARALGNRQATANRLRIDLPSPRHVTLAQQSGAYLNQEIARIGSDCSHVLLDVAGHDSPIARRAIAMADTLVTPINNSFADLDLLGQFDAMTMKLKELGHFSRLVASLRDARERLGMPLPDWIVVQNRRRRSGSNEEARIDHALGLVARKAGFRLGHGLGERVAYRDMFLSGLSHLDHKYVPKLAKMKVVARQEVERLLDDLRLPGVSKDQPGLFETAPSGNSRRQTAAAVVAA